MILDLAGQRRKKEQRVRTPQHLSVDQVVVN
jgi:hypothetical protein